MGGRQSFFPTEAMVRAAIALRPTDPNVGRLGSDPAAANDAEQARDAGGDAGRGDERAGQDDPRGERFGFAKLGSQTVCYWPGGNPTDTCYRLAGYCGISPRGLTLRELWLMAAGRRRESRIHAVEQAALVWCVNNIDVSEFIQTGEIEAGEKARPLDPHLQAQVDAQIKAIFENNGKLIMPKE